MGRGSGNGGPRAKPFDWGFAFRNPNASIQNGRGLYLVRGTTLLRSKSGPDRDKSLATILNKKKKNNEPGEQWVGAPKWVVEHRYQREIKSLPWAAALNGLCPLRRLIHGRFPRFPLELLPTKLRLMWARECVRFGQFCASVRAGRSQGRNQWDFISSLWAKHAASTSAIICGGSLKPSTCPVAVFPVFPRYPNVFFWWARPVRVGIHYFK